MAEVNMVALVILHAGPAASTEYTFPVTSPHFITIAAPVIGLVPILPVTEDLYTLVIPVLERIAKLPALIRFTSFKTGTSEFSVANDPIEASFSV